MKKKAERKGFVYILTCLVNNKGYVGQTIKSKPEIRWVEHINAARRGDRRPLYCAIRKYGVENFLAEVIWIGSEAKLDAAEVRFVRLRKTFIDTGWGYNLTTGGGTRRKLSAASRRKISESICAAYDADPTYRVRAGGSTKGYKRSFETRCLLSVLATKQFSKVVNRVKASKAGKRRFENVIERSKASIRTSKHMSTKVVRELQSRNTIKQFAVKGAREALSVSAKKRYNERPELRKIIGDNSRKRWANKAERAKLMRSLRKVWCTKEHSEICSKAQKKRFSNPEERAKASASKKASWAALPEWRKEEIREAKRRAARTPKAIERNRRAQLRRYALHPYTDEQRKQRSISAAKDWERRRQEAACEK